jgi:cardiolipin synthase A/B
MLELALSGVIFVAAVVASGHAVIYKREPRAAALWVVVIWLLPAAGPVLYLLLGVNRVRRHAVAMRGDMVHHRTTPDLISVGSPPQETSFRPEAEHFRLFAQLVERVTARPLLPGNLIVPLVNGVEAYPAMLEAMESATESIGLATYIFDSAGAGERFVDALARSKKRGVEVSVLIDAVGANYSWPPVSRSLRDHGINVVALFNPRLMPQWLPAVNLRNHRKILVVDGKIGFTGGFNIKREYWNPESLAQPFRDLHFRLSGPVVAHLSEVFVDDWQFATGESLRGEKWFPNLSLCDGMIARGIEAGPTRALSDCAGSLSVRLMPLAALCASSHPTSCLMGGSSRHSTPRRCAVSMWTSSCRSIPISPTSIGPPSVSFGKCSSAAAVCG